MIFHSIRWRLQAWHGLLLVLVLSGFGTTAYHVARDNQLRRVDQELEQHLIFLFRPRRPQSPPGGPAAPPGEHPHNHRGEGAEFMANLCEAVTTADAHEEHQTNTFYYGLWGADGTLLARSAGAPADVGGPELTQSVRTRAVDAAKPEHSPPKLVPPPSSQARTRGQNRELFRFLPHGECLLVGRSLAPELASMQRLALVLTGAGAGVLLLGLAGGWWVAGRAIRPIDQISAAATKIAGGELSQRIDVADTDSELGRLADLLNATFARLEAAFAQQARFTADASHELRTPLAVIVNQTQGSLARERSPSEYREALQACQRAAQRMRKLTDTLLALARLDAGEEPLKREQCDLSQLAQECIELLKPLAQEHGVRIDAELPPTRCLGDPHRLSQVLINLLTNSIQFNRPDGTVQVQAQAQSGLVTLSITDTGEGISAEDLPHIFERFYRADKARSRSRGGTGLGLAISKAIVEAHGGTLTAASEPGHGAVFTLALPIK